MTPSFEVLLGTQPDFEVVGPAADGEVAVRLCPQLRPDAVLMDIRMPGMGGIEATRRILADQASAGPRVLILTTVDLDEHVYDALDAGASGFLQGRHRRAPVRRGPGRRGRGGAAGASGDEASGR